MIHPSRDRLNYCDSIKPDSGYHVSKAICFTYSLDFVSLLSTCFVLAVNDDLSEKYKNKFIPSSQIVEILMNFKDKLFIFADVSEIKKPKIDNEILTIFDSCIKKTDSKSFKSFHSKLWLIEYTKNDDDNAFKYKLLISSRNLTISNDWDFGLCLEDFESEKPMNDSLCNLLKSTGESSFDDLIKRLKFRQFKNPIDKTHFKIWDVYNTCGDKNKEVFFDKISKHITKIKHKERMLVVSPFVSSDVLKSIDKTTDGQVILVTREDSLTNIDKDLFDNEKFKTFILMDDYISADEENELIGNIHAKIYLIQYKNKKSRLIFGSSNCTNNGLCLNKGSNLEANVLLDFNDANFFDSFKEELFIEKLNVFEEVSSELYETIKNKTKEEDDSFEAADVLKQIVLKQIKGSYDKNNQTISLRPINKVDTKSFEVYITHFSRPGNYQRLTFNNPIVFENISFKNASNFFLIKIIGKKTYERVIIADIKNLDLDGRDQELLNSFIQNQEDVVQYLSYLFGLGHFNGSVEDLEYDFTVNQGSDYRYYGSIEAPLYEKALELSYSDPKRLKAIVEKYKKLPDSARTDEKLEYFMNVFLESVK